MNFIYDILLNFNKDYYEFYEWQKNDNIVNIRKLPIFKISCSDYDNFKYNDIVVDNSFIKKINGLTSTYSRIKYDNCCLFCDGKRVMGVLFNNNGLLVKRSCLLLDEEEEVLEEIYDKVSIKINYKVNKVKVISNDLRIEKEKKDYIKKYLYNLTDDLKLKYIYYDYYEEEIYDNIDIKKKLLDEINNNWSECQKKLFDLIVLFNKIKN